MSCLLFWDDSFFNDGILEKHSRLVKSIRILIALLLTGYYSPLSTRPFRISINTHYDSKLDVRVKMLLTYFALTNVLISSSTLEESALQ